MHVVVTGGAGFIGSWVVRRLRERGDTVTVLDIAAPDEVDADADGVQSAGEVDFVKGSVLDPDAVHESARGADAVVHLAGFVRSGMCRQPYLGASLQLQGTLNVLEACRVQGVRQLGYASTFYVYDGRPSDETVDEYTPLDPAVMELFGSAKFMGELLCADYARRDDLDVTTFRIGPAYGGQGSSAMDDFVEAGLRGETIEIWGRGQRRNQYTFVGDVADAIVAGLDRGHGTYNLVSPEAVRLQDLAELLAEYQIKAIFDPTRPEGPSLPYIRADKAMAELEWSPRPVATGLRQVVRNLSGGMR
jgi:UDP-glucose 4-epimerase